MVADPSQWLSPTLGAASPRTGTLLERLDPSSRAKVLMALVGLVLVGLALMALAWAGGRQLRRIARQRPRKIDPPDDRWYYRPFDTSDSSADEAE